MGSIFKHIYADFAYEFQQDFESFADDEHSLLQRICDVTGVVLIKCNDSPQKLFGPWDSVKSAHDLLSGFLLFRTLQKTIAHEKKKSPTFPDIGDENDSRSTTVNVKSLPKHSQEKCPGNQNENRSTSVINLDSDDNSTMIHRGQESKKNQLDECMDVEKMSEMYQNESRKNMQIPLTTKFGRRENLEEADRQDTRCKKDILHIEPYIDMDGNEIYHCDMCSYVGYKKRNLFIHRIRTHLRPYKCGRCCRGFGLHKDLVRHYKNKRNCSNYGAHYKGMSKCRRFQQSNDLQSSFTAAPRSEHDQVQLSISSSSNKINENVLESNRSNPHMSHAKESIGHNDNVLEDGVDDEKNSRFSFAENSAVLSSYDNGSFQTQFPMWVGRKKRFRRRFQHMQDPEEASFHVHNIKQEIPDEEPIEASYEVHNIKQEIVDEADTETGNNPCSREIDTNQDASSDPVGSVVEAFPTLMRMLHSPGHDDQMHKSPSTDAYQKHIENQRKVKYSSSFARQTSEEEQMIFPCDYCGFSSPRRQQLEDHIKRIHCKQFECEICGSMFGMIKDLNRHYRRTHKMQIDYQRRGRRAQEEPLKITVSTYEPNNHV